MPLLPSGATASAQQQPQSARLPDKQQLRCKVLPKLQPSEEGRPNLWLQLGDQLSTVAKHVGGWVGWHIGHIQRLLCILPYVAAGGAHSCLCIKLSDTCLMLTGTFGTTGAVTKHALLMVRRLQSGGPSQATARRPWSTPWSTGTLKLRQRPSAGERKP
jgi:hypothetical protein